MAGKTTYVYCPKLKKLVLKSEFFKQQSASVHVFEPFTSTVDGTRIRDSAQLRAHNRKHGVTDPRDYGPDWFTRKHKEQGAAIQGQTPQDKAHRIELLKRGFEHHGY